LLPIDITKVKKLLLIALAAICFLGCHKKQVKPAVVQDRDPVKIASDPSNYGYHSIGQETGMCYGFAINLMDRLNKQADVSNVWIMSIMGIGNPQPTSPDREPNRWLLRKGKIPTDWGIWWHAIVLFTTSDNKIYAVDENVSKPVEINLDLLDWTSDDIMSNFPEVVIRQLWSTWKSRYPFAWESFKASAPTFYYGKQDIFDNFGKSADVYFTMQNHAYRFPEDWCVD